MTEEERIELLQQVAECAPRELCVRHNPRSVEFWYPHHPDLDLRLDLDMSDGGAIVVMLDAMEKAGYVCEISPSWIPATGEDLGSPYSSEVRDPKQKCNCGDENCPDALLITCEIGDTRAEAVARAFVAVFGKKKSPDESGEGR